MPSHWFESISKSIFTNKADLKKQGRIIHRSGLNHENNKNRNEKKKNRKSKISYLTVHIVKADIS